jgi:RNA polymerase sigma-70 factor (ECF subfamily)
MPVVAGEHETREDEGGLIVRARAGGAEGHSAFRQLFDRYKREVFSVLLRLLREQARAEDALQETFFRVHLALDRLDPARPFRPWVHQVARNVAIDALRAQRKEARLAARAPSSEQAPPDEALAHDEHVAHARAALDALPDETRALLLQRHAAGLTLAELARSLDVSERTVVERLREGAGLLAQAIALRLGRKRP